MASGTFYPVVSGDDGLVYTTNFFNATSDLYFGDSGGTTIDIFIRFPSANIPQGSTIIAAYIKFTSYNNASVTTFNANIYFNDIDDAIAPTDAAEFNNLVLTNAIAWNAVSAWTDGTQYNTPELKTILQIIVDRGGWASSNAVQVVLKNNASSANAMRHPSSIDYLSGAEKAELHVTWSTLGFTFTDSIPAHLSTVYGTTEQVCLTTTISGPAADYVYDASFYDESDVQIGSTVSGIQSGQPAESNEYLSTPSGIDYSWYMTATSSGGEDTSSTYTFHNRFLYEGYVTENNSPISRKVNLYYRNTGELVDTTTSSGSNGYYKLSAVNNDTHFIVAFDDEVGEDYNALILDKLLPVGTE